MIITETKPFGMIRAKLKKSDRISLVVCNTCAKMCGTGGKKGLDEIEEDLKKTGYNVVDSFLSILVCNKNIIKKTIKPKGNIILVLACDAGVYCIKKLCRGKTVIAVLDTVGLGVTGKEGNLFLIRKFK